MTKLLSRAQRLEYEHEGVLFPLPVLSAEEAQRYRAACDDLELHLGGKPRTINVRQMHLHFRWAYELATHPRLLDAIEDLLGPNLIIWATELFSKHPRDSAVAIAWHRDRPYMGFEPRLTTTAWISLANSTAANGCMRVVPGSHLDASGVGDLARGQQPDETETINILLQPGEMSLHHSEVLHGSSANHADEKRIGFVVRFVAAEARALHGRPPAIVARGRCVHNGFEIVDPPAEDEREQALREMKQSAVRHLDNMLHNLQASTKPT